MAVPKRKTTQSKRNMRRAHDSIKSGTYHECQDSGELKLMHHISPDGWYRGRQIIQPKVNTEDDEANEA